MWPPVALLPVFLLLSCHSTPAGATCLPPHSCCRTSRCFMFQVGFVTQTIAEATPGAAPLPLAHAWLPQVTPPLLSPFSTKRRAPTSGSRRICETRQQKHIGAKEFARTVAPSSAQRLVWSRRSKAPRTSTIPKGTVWKTSMVPRAPMIYECCTAFDARSCAGYCRMILRSCLCTPPSAFLVA